MDSAAASTQSLQVTDDYLLLDPRASRMAGLGMAGSSSIGSGVAGPPNRNRRMGFNEGIVFVVGGAGYVEYGNLMEWAGKTGKKVTYGGTEIIAPSGFVEVLEKLGKAAP